MRKDVVAPRECLKTMHKIFRRFAIDKTQYKYEGRHVAVWITEAA